MAQGKTPTIRKNVTFSQATIDYLEDLAKHGTHGSDVPDVIRTLVEEGVRNAIKEQFIDRKK